MLFFKIELKNCHDLIFMECKLVSHTMSFTGLVHDFPCEFSTIESGTYKQTNKKKHWQKIGFSNNYPSMFGFSISWILKIWSKIIFLFQYSFNKFLNPKSLNLLTVHANPAANSSWAVHQCNTFKGLGLRLQCNG